MNVSYRSSPRVLIHGSLHDLTPQAVLQKVQRRRFEASSSSGTAVVPQRQQSSLMELLRRWLRWVLPPGPSASLEGLDRSTSSSVSHSPASHPSLSQSLVSQSSASEKFSAPTASLSTKRVPALTVSMSSPLSQARAQQLYSLERSLQLAYAVGDRPQVRKLEEQLEAFTGWGFQRDRIWLNSTSPSP